MDVSDPAPRGPSHLLNLPAELRNIIHHFAIVEPKPLFIQKTFIRCPTSLKPAKRPALSMTCKQLEQEVLPIFFGENSFVSDARHRGKSFENTITSWAGICEPYVSLIRSIGVASFFGAITDDIFPISVQDITELELCVIATMHRPDNQIEVQLSGGLKDKCISVISDPEFKEVFSRGGSDFIEDAMSMCRIDAIKRLTLGDQECAACGKAYGV